MKKLYILLVVAFVGFIGNAQIINFPDANFKAKLLSASAINNHIAISTGGAWMTIDADGDGEIQVSEAALVSILNLSPNTANSEISDLTGLSYLTGLTDLDCGNNTLLTFDRSVLGDYTKLVSLRLQLNSLTSVNVSGMTNLRFLEVNDNNLTSLDITGLNSLESLNCFYNQITSLTATSNLKRLNCNWNPITNLNLDNCTSLVDLNCVQNQLSSLNINHITTLQYVDCYFNQLTSLAVNNLDSLVALNCSHNQITSFDVAGMNELMNFSCANNLLTELDVSQAPKVSGPNCSYNPNLATLNTKNGRGSSPYFESCPALRYICVDAGALDTVNSRIQTYGYTNCFANTYCSFIPGGTFYSILGKNKFDANTNGCDDADYAMPNLKVKFLNGSTSSTVISDYFGEFKHDVQSGTHVLTPVLENPTYYTVSPASVSIGFPATASPVTQNFCITANGSHPDLEIALYPTSSARPGFSGGYVLIYKNKGNVIQSGSVTFTYDGTKMQYVSGSAVITSQTANSITWNFTNLNALVSRYINLNFRVNSPTDTPAVNGGDFLNFTATVTGLTDEVPADNTTTMRQDVINSYDPNDKVCTEGPTIGTAMIGKYLHYIIRFENNGTANAENIVVKDLINTIDFDINSLMPLHASHPFATRITGTGIVEFIFENINLPFDNANNDGYIAFKIKTRTSLNLGSVVRNYAQIYFDYNFPITTNNYRTTVVALGNQDFEFNNVFTLSPVPAKEMLTITAKQDVIMNSASIYNTLGQLVHVITDPKENIDVSELNDGNYFIRIFTDKGSATGKFIKE
ncbi:MAG: T9SS type A sorting domain-containing protein [Flavobacterium sp. JAD_PAG50586_2]|nr:MAG: T9SS type A sorting domain-containing protein [Flavobacterium sp. JAD_PAG50586_2]